MPFSFGTAVLVVNVLFCLSTAWTSATAPDSFAGRLGLAIVDPGGLNEVRAQYSGFFLAIGAVCLASLCGLLTRQTSFVIMFAVYGGLLAGRLVSLVLNGGTAGYGPTILALYAVDTVGLVLAVASLVLDQRGTA
ncbi:hypothetical protein [Bradyrhizobium sp.]|uniref:hypothetical protein n=1 Tax=Bradyrhizobium sp. TaxID=376 RepID=UPI003C677F71